MVDMVLLANWLETDKDIVRLSVGIVGLCVGVVCGKSVECLAR